MAALTLPLVTEATTEEERDTCAARCRPTFHRRPHIIPENVDSRLDTHHYQHKGQRGNGKISNGIKGSLWVSNGLASLKINTSQQLFLRLLTTRVCGRRAGLRTLQQTGRRGCPPMILFAHHTYGSWSKQPNMGHSSHHGFVGYWQTFYHRPFRINH